MLIKKRKGMMLPLIIVISVFIMGLGAVLLTISGTGRSQSYANIEKMQSYNLAKAGIEMGMAFLYSPSQPGNPNSANWFENAKKGKDFDQILDELKSATNPIGTSSSNTEEVEVYLKTKEVAGNREIESAHIYKRSDTTTIREGYHFGDIVITISLVDKGEPKAKKLDESVYQIISTATLIKDKGPTVNTRHQMTMEVSVLNEFDRTIR